METSFGKPYSERLDDGIIIRSFSELTPEDEFVWHRDHNDREIVATTGRGWKIQFDNQMPEEIKIGKTFYVKKGEYHRLLKGNDNLTLRIKEL